MAVDVEGIDSLYLGMPDGPAIEESYPFLCLPPMMGTCLDC